MKLKDRFRNTFFKGIMSEENDTIEKVEMAQTQLHFIKYASEEILEFIKMGGKIEEWYQNKLSKVHSDMESLHSYIEGEMRRTGMKEEKEQTDEKFGYKVLGEERGIFESYWQYALKKAEADREARKGKPFEKNPASHDKQGIYKGEKDLAGNPIPRRKKIPTEESVGKPWYEKDIPVPASKTQKQPEPLKGMKRVWDGTRWKQVPKE